MTSFFQDVQYAWRSVWKTRSVTAAVLVSLSLGIGSTAAIFNLIDTLVLRPLPVPEPDRIVSIASVTQSAVAGTLSNLEFEELRKRSQSFEGVTSSWGGTPIFWLSSKPGQSAHLAGAAAVSGDFFSTMRIEPVLGRAFRPEEDQAPGRDAVTVIAHRLWQREFGGSPDVVGKTIRINGRDFSIIGVAPASFTGLDPTVLAEVYVPRMMFGSLIGTEAGDPGSALILARLKPAVTLERAREDVQRIAKQLEQERPGTNRGRSFNVYTQYGLLAAESPAVTIQLGLFFLIAGLVLAVACVNVANLLLSGAAARVHDVAVRTALGASRSRLLRGMLIESVMMSMVGSFGGLGIAELAGRWISSIVIIENLPVSLNLRVDMRIVLFAAAVGLVSGFLSGLIPALRCSRANLNAILKSEDARLGRSVKTWGRQTLVAAQMAIAVIVMVASGSAFQRLENLRNMDPGFRANDVLTVSFYPTSLHEDEKNRRLYKQVVDRVSSMPGVRSAAIGFPLPLSTFSESLNLTIDGYSMPRDQSSVQIPTAMVSDTYFETLGIPVLQGRAFDAHDTRDSAKVAVINQAMAEKYWQRQNPVGSRMKILEPFGLAHGGDVQVIGVARDSKYGGINEEPQPFVYLAAEQHEQRLMTLFVRTKTDPSSFAESIRSEIMNIERDAPVWDVRPLTQHVRRQSLIAEELIADIITSIATVGLVLGVLGLYGVIAYSVSQRTHEIGIRMAIGATHWRVFRMVLMQGLKVGGLGIATGAALVLELTALVAQTFAPINPTVILFEVIPLMIAVTVLACYLPARRASRVDPNITLRCQ